MSTTKKVIIVVVVLAAIAVGYYFWKKSKAKKATELANASNPSSGGYVNPALIRTATDGLTGGGVMAA